MTPLLVNEPLRPVLDRVQAEMLCFLATFLNVEGTASAVAICERQLAGCAAGVRETVLRWSCGADGSACRLQVPDQAGPSAMSIPVVTSASETQRQAAISTIVLAFAQDPLARWVTPDAAAYLALMPAFVAAFGGNGLTHGSTYLVDGGAGAAMWLPPGVHPDDERMDQLMREYVTGQTLEDMQGVFEQMAGYHPEVPHWYLPIIGVDPAHQGRGLGAALMRRALERCDADGATAYLESSNPRNISLYQRHGFEALGVIQVGGSPEVVPMLRTPR